MDCLEHTNLPIGFVVSSIVLTTSISPSHKMSPEHALGIENRRKKSFFAQEALVLLAQLSHNLLAYFKEWLLGATDAGKLGMERLLREVLAMPAEARTTRRG